MNRRRRTGHWLMWGGTVLMAGSFVTCSGIGGGLYSPPWLLTLATWLIGLGLVMLLAGLVVIARSGRE